MPILGAQPGGDRHGEAIERVTQRLAEHFDTVGCPDIGEYMRRVVALPRPRLEQLPRMATCQQRLEKQPPGRACGETSAGNTRDRGDLARVVRIKP